VLPVQLAWRRARRTEASPAENAARWLGAQFDEVEVARRPDDGVDLFQRRREHLARHDREGRPAHGAVVHRIVHEHAARTAELESGGVEIAEGAQPRFFADLGRVGEQGGDHDVEQVEHIVLRGRLQRAHESEQRCRPPLQRHACHGLGLGDGREPGERRDPARWYMIDGRQAQRQHPDLVQATHGAGQLRAAAKIWPVT